MKPPGDDGARVAGPRAAFFLAPAVLALIALFPPETRGEALAGGAILMAVISLLAIRSRLDVPRLAPTLLVPLLAVPLVLAAETPGAAVRPLAIGFLALAAGVALSTLPARTRLGTVVPWALAVVGTLVALHGLYQKLWGLDALVALLEQGMAVPDRELILQRAAGGRAFAGFPTPAALGGYLALTVPVTLGLAMQRPGRARVALVLLTAVQAAGLLAAASATAGAALVGALLIAGAVHRGMRRPVLAGIAAALVLLVAVAALRGTELFDREDPNSPWRLRAANVRLATSVAADHPWIGVGPGGFGEAYPGYRQPGDNETQHAHNLPLELAAELGWPLGGLVAGAFFWLFLGPLLRAQQGWWRGAAVGLAAFALHNLADFTAFLPSLLWSAALLRGAVSRPATEVCSSRLLPAVAATGVVVAAVAALLSGLAWNERSAARQAAAEGDAVTAHRHADRAVRLAPWQADGWLLRAGATLSGPDDASLRLQNALTDVERAVVLAPARPASRRMRAELRRALGDVPGAFADATLAVELYPMRRPYAELRDALAKELPSPERSP